MRPPEETSPGAAVDGAAPAVDLAADGEPVHVGYLMSRFPTLTETFILRELQGVDAQPGVRVTLMSLYPTEDPVVHAESAPWVAKRHLPGAAQVVGAVLRRLVRTPGRTLAVWGRVAWEHREHPTILAKALVACGLGFAHAEHVERTGVRHVHAHFAWMPALAAWVVERLTGVPYSTTAHAHDVFSHQAGLGTRLRGARFVVGISRYHRMFLMHFGARAGATPLLPLGLDLDRYGFRPRAIPADGPVDVLCISSMRTYKGHRYLVEALATDARLTRVRLELVGRGPLEDEVRALVARRGLGDRVTFTGGLDQREVLERLDAAHVLVQPSIVEDDGHTEGLPTTLVEAAASGATMVATRVTGVPDIVREDETGFLAEPADPASLADALARAIAHPDPQALQRRARAHVEEFHDLRRVGPVLAAWFASSARGEPFLDRRPVEVREELDPPTT